jgi:hypothetical protein
VLVDKNYAGEPNSNTGPLTEIDMVVQFTTKDNNKIYFEMTRQLAFTTDLQTNK